MRRKSYFDGRKQISKENNEVSQKENESCDGGVQR
jgi:hypothetical protein